MGIRDPSVRMTSSLKIQLKTDASTCFGEFGRIRSAWLMLVLSYDVIASANEWRDSGREVTVNSQAPLCTEGNALVVQASPLPSQLSQGLLQSMKVRQSASVP
ncbi:hypothetical protein RB195_011000 [Necator americanus]|uniref:Uncharacterized protein n=1 Tax=Necator americanus TaxID=51031 RepID=A0ABR1D0J9_NECAM